MKAPAFIERPETARQSVSPTRRGRMSAVSAHQRSAVAWAASGEAALAVRHHDWVR